MKARGTQKKRKYGQSKILEFTSFFEVDLFWMMAESDLRNRVEKRIFIVKALWAPM